MADRTTDKSPPYSTAPRCGIQSYRVADGVVLGRGALVQLASGYLDHWDETGKFVGIVIGGKDRANDGVITGEISDTPIVEAIVDESGETLRNVAIAGTFVIGSVGVLVYCADSDPASFTITDTTNPPVGRAVRWHSNGVGDVQLFTPAEWLAGDAGAAWAS